MLEILIKISIQPNVFEKRDENSKGNSRESHIRLTFEMQVWVIIPDCQGVIANKSNLIEMAFSNYVCVVTSLTSIFTGHNLILSVMTCVKFCSNHFISAILIWVRIELNAYQNGIMNEKPLLKWSLENVKMKVHENPFHIHW